MNLFGPNINKMEENGDINGLCQALRHKNDGLREKAAIALDHLNWTPEDDENKAWYFVAKRNWSELAKLGESSLAPLLLALQHSEDGVRIAAGNTLELIALSNSKDAVPIISETLCNQMIEPYAKFTWMRTRTVDILGKTGDVRVVLPLIQSVLKLRHKEDMGQTGSYATRKYPLSDALKNLTLQVITDIGEPAITPLIEALSSEDTDPEVKSYSSRIIPLLGTPAVTPLIKLLDSENKKVRYAALEALSRIDDDRIIDLMIKSLRDNYRFCRTTAYFYLRDKSWQPTNPEEKAYYLIAEILANYDIEAKVDFVKIKINELVALGEQAVNPLIFSLNIDGKIWQKGYSVALGIKVDNTQIEARYLITHLLVKIGKPAIPALESALLESDPIMKREAQEALKRIK